MDEINLSYTVSYLSENMVLFNNIANSVCDTENRVVFNNTENRIDGDV